MIILVACYYTHEFWNYVLPRVSAAKSNIKLMTDKEIQTDETKYIRISTGTEVRQAARVYSNLQFKLLPCYNLLGDKANVDRALSELRNSPCENQ